jgi:Txe/YoeB family toxin of toxin-antitoxin system
MIKQQKHTGQSSFLVSGQMPFWFPKKTGAPYKKLCIYWRFLESQALLHILELDPIQNPPPYEKLVGDLKGAYSSRINIQHRLVYEVIRKEKTVRILRMWTHYE